MGAQIKIIAGEKRLRQILCDVISSVGEITISHAIALQYLALVVSLTSLFERESGSVKGNRNDFLLDLYFALTLVENVCVAFVVQWAINVLEGVKVVSFESWTPVPVTCQ